jgi:integrase
MAKLTKKIIDRLQIDDLQRGNVYWDSELKGFGLRVYPTGAKTFVLKFRTRSGRQRWLKLGAFGPLTAETAREKAKLELARVVDGDDPADARDQIRSALTVAQLCDLYLTAAEAGLVTGRKDLPKKASTLSADRSRINAHIKPLLGALKACEVTRSDVEAFKIGVVTGRAKRDERLGPRRRSIVRGGKGAATRTLGLLGALFAWGQDNGFVETNPVRGVRRFADRQKKALLTPGQYRALARALEALGTQQFRHGGPAHSQVGLDAIRFLALSGLRKSECQNLRWDEVDAHGACLALGDTKTGPSLRPLSQAAFALIEAQTPHSDFVFAARSEGPGYQGLPGLWRTVQRKARQVAEAEARAIGAPAPVVGPLDEATLHSLRHSFAGVAEQLGATIPTIAALLGHRVGGVTGGYILKRVDLLLVDTANRVGRHIEHLMQGDAPPIPVVQFTPRGRR